MSVSRVRVDGVELNVVDEGQGPAVVLLHGFPDSLRLWRHQTPALVAAGYRVIVPDLRGFGESDKPEAVEDYALRVIVGDVIALLDTLEVEQAHVVGHGLGSAVAWVLARVAPDRVRRLVAVSVGHPAVRRLLGFEQHERSSHRLFFQFSEAEELLRADDWKLFREWLREDGDVDRYVEDLSLARSTDRGA